MNLCYFSIAAVICCHKFSSLKPHKFIISQFWRSEVWVAQLASLFNLSQSWNKTVDWPGLLFGSFRKEQVFRPMQIVGRIQFPVVVGLMPLFSCWLPPGGCSQVLEVTHILWLVAFLLNLQNQQLGYTQ